MPIRKCSSAILALFLSIPFTAHVLGANWPTYQHDNRRSGVTSERLEPPLSEQWVFESPWVPAPAWGDPQPKPVEGNLELPRLRFDDAFHVAAVGGRVYFASSADGMVYALDASSGELRWSAHTGGPVRLAPTVWQGRLYVGSDDGFVYCLDAAGGDVLWTFRAAPHPDKVLGNGKLISLWPLRTGVLVDSGIAYFGAGVFPSEGLYLYAVSADSGKLIWKNDAYGRGGLGDMSPQGYLLASASKLFVSSGRCAPGVFDRASGKGLYQPNPSWRRDGLFGGTYALLAGGRLYNGTEQIIAYTQETGKLVHTAQGRRLIVAEGCVYLMTGKEILALDPKAFPEMDKRRQALKKNSSSRKKLQESLVAARKELSERTEKKEALTRQITETETKLDALAKEREELARFLEDATRWRCPFRGDDVLILAGGVLFAGGGDRVVAIDTAAGKKQWTGKVSGKARGLAVANGRLLVSTDKGSIHCFGRAATPSPRHAGLPPADPAPYPSDKLTRFYEQTAQAIISDTNIKRGYCLILGGDGRLALELAKRTELIVYLVEPDTQNAATARKAITAAGLYGARVCVDQRPLSGLCYPPYFANLIICADSLLTGKPSTPPEELLSMLKPHGGVAYVGQPPWAGELAASPETPGLQPWLERLRDGSTDVELTGTTWARVNRGALQGAGNWTHQYANPGNTTCSDDELVKGPLGILWFGEPGPGRMPSRHASNVAPLSVNGRLFVQGEEVISAYDAYNGLLLWEREIAGAMRLRMGFTSESSNLAASKDSLFVAVDKRCLRLDAATGTTRKTYSLPAREDGKSSRWGYLACVGNTLLGSRTDKGKVSDCVFAVDVDTGRRKWVHHAGQVNHDSIAIGDGRLWLVDNVETDEQREQALREKSSGAVGRKGEPDVRLVVALDLATGEQFWEKPLDVSDCVKIERTGGELSAMYSDGILLLCAAPWNGHFWREFFEGKFSRRSIIVLSGDDGELLWSDHIGYRSRPLIVGDTIYAEPWAYDLRTGAARMRIHPITGQETKWQMARPGHHCGCIAASPNCLFFRSWSTAYYDLGADYGTCHYGAQRPGCWINFIPAGGLVLIPEASSGCMCPFPIHCTIVLYPRRINRVWGMYSAAGPMTPVRHMAINFGAAGDRKDAEGTLWLSYPRPRRGRPDHSPPRHEPLVLDFELHEELQPGGFYHRYNAEGRNIPDTGKPWLFSSWCRGLTRCTLPLIGKDDEPRRYTVRLYFAELDDVRPGQRVFSVAIQGREVLTDLDVVREAGGPERPVIRQFEGVRVEDGLNVSLMPSPSAAVPTAAMCGIEVVAE